MSYQEYSPTEALHPYVKCYYMSHSGADHVSNDHAFATGCLEIMFNLDGAQWQTKKNGIFGPTAAVELWGQVINPRSLRLVGRSHVMGIRFHPFGAAPFLNEHVCAFNDQVIDLSEVMGTSLETLHVSLQHTSNMADKIRLVESFLLKRLHAFRNRNTKIGLVRQVMKELSHEDFFDNIDNVASRYGITSRYLQKVFLQYTGLTPKLYSKVSRFQKSLILIGGGQTLTSVAHESGYYDQSHFIREFKTFTGMTPSAFDASNSSAILASPAK